MAELGKKKSEAGKNKRISHKVARSEDQEEQKKWVKRQAILHTYDHDDDNIGDQG